MKVYFFPGVGADESLARFHPLPGHDVEWIRWPEKASATWPGFLAALMGENKIKPGAIFIGISFGGMVAQMLASMTKPAGIILIGSSRSSKSVSPLLRAFRPFILHLPEFLFDMRLLPKRLVTYFFGIKDKDDIDLLYEMGSRLPPVQFKHVNALALHFEGEKSGYSPLFSIHGGRDRMILANAENRDKIISEGGHLISMTHASIVNEYLLGWIKEIENCSANFGEEI